MGTRQEIEALIFDLDGTLYDDPDLLAAYPRLALEMMAARLGVAQQEAARRYEETWSAQATEGQGAASTTRVLMALAGVTLEEWAQYLAARLDPRDYLAPERQAWMRALFPRLHKRYRMGLVTNNNRVLADRILDLLGIAACFDALLTTTESHRLKPDPTLYLEMAALLGVPASACLSLGDRLAADIEPARAAGLQAELVHGPEDLRRIVEGLLSGEVPGPDGARQKRRR